MVGKLLKRVEQRFDFGRERERLIEDLRRLPDLVFGPSPGEEGRRGDWVLTSDGKRVWPFDVRPEDVDPIDLARSLSRLARFNGKTREFYSVAQHSVLVACAVSGRHPDDPFEVCQCRGCAEARGVVLAALLHDTPEGLGLGDVVRPVKRHLLGYEGFHERSWRAVAGRFGLPEEMPEIVEEMDNRVLLTEKRDLLPEHPWLWGDPQARDGEREPMPWRIECWGPAEGERRFLEALAVLCPEKDLFLPPISREGTVNGYQGQAEEEVAE